MLYFIDIFGVVAFAISGVLVAQSKRMDPFGILIIAFVTATGGGMLRDVLIGDTPVIWMKNPVYVYLIFGATVFGILFRSKIDYLRTSLFLFDTIGIGLYTVIGVEKGLTAGLAPPICISLGIMSACFGGVIRDILCNEIPVIFSREIYATACFVGASCYLILLKLHVPTNINFVISVLVVIIIRLVAVRFKIALPSVYKD
ncbi:trimeric intracellular cation channel family protein [Formosa sp. S-31]|uniref:trimeric intracellular cation channel family protein n=1 Tax=Formosa sp. S-31 TaxID=2790949 RepID=UPI003EBCC931